MNAKGNVKEVMLVLNKVNSGIFLVQVYTNIRLMYTVEESFKRNT